MVRFSQGPLDVTDRAPITHELKTWPPYYQEVHQGRKNFEVRLNDRDFRPMDVLKLREYDPAVYARVRDELLSQGIRRDRAEEQAMEDAYTGRSCERMVGYILYGGDPAIVGMEAAHSGIAPGYVVMSLVSTVADNDAKLSAWQEKYERDKPPIVRMRSARG